MANVVIIRSPSLFAAGALTLSATPPIGLAYLASSVRHAGHHVSFIDGIGQDIEHVYYFGSKNLYVNGMTIDAIVDAVDPQVDFICVSFPFSHEYPLTKRLCHALRVRFPHVTILGGGEHITALPEFSLRDCPSLDYVVLGEGEETVVDLLDALVQKKNVALVAGVAFLDGDVYVASPRRERMKAINEIPRPAWDLLPLETYLAGGYSFGVNIGRTIPLIATRGCPYQCTFCSNPLMWTTRWLARDPLDVVLEMEDYIRKYRVTNFDFYDLTAIVRKDWTVEFCKLIIDRKLNITWQLPSGTRSEALDDEVTKLLYASGCRNLSYAPESGSPDTLKQIKKKINPDRMLESMRHSIKNKINIKANMIIGFPNERLKNILESYWFIMRMAWVGVDDVSVWVFSAYPGSEIFNDLSKNGRMVEYTDDYFTSLLSYSDLNNVVSWNEHFSSAQLKYMRILGLMLFYGCSFLFRPWRLVRTIRNVVAHKPQSRFEMIVEKALSRHKKQTPKSTPVPVGGLTT